VTEGNADRQGERRLTYNNMLPQNTNGGGTERMEKIT
jgi:hypothetical protein